MTEQFADLIEGGVLAEKVRRKGMAEQVCSLPDGIDASAYQRPPDDRRNCDRMSKTAERRSVPEKRPGGNYTAAGRSAGTTRWPHRHPPVVADEPSVHPCTES